MWGTLGSASSVTEPARFIPTGVGNTSCLHGYMSSVSVHPHGCGEHLLARAGTCNHIGSSPRVWGTLQIHGRIQQHLRFIPTGVGNTHPPSSNPRLISVHPHGCGEHVKLRKSTCLPRGSSPRVWGTRVCKNGRLVSFRFIPTGVGNTAASAASCASCAVHPHGWGTRGAGSGHTRCHRFIPTGVGNTSVCVGMLAWFAVHPHGCGEHANTLYDKARQRGSSPRVWGTHQHARVLQPKPRFIPTGVGNTKAAPGCGKSGSVHPHGCGEHECD